MNDGLPTLLGAKSWYSLLDGAMSPEDLCMRAVEGGWGSIAIADSDNLYCLPAFVDAAADAGLKPIAGARLEGRNGAVRAYCMDRRGYGRLCSIITRVLASKAGAEGPDGGQPASAARYDPLEDLAADGWEGLALVVRDGSALAPLARAAARASSGRSSSGHGAAGDANGGAGVGHAPASHNHAAAAGGQGAAGDADRADSLPSLLVGIAPGAAQEGALALARRFGVPLVAEHPATFSAPDDRRRWRLLRAVAERLPLSRIGAGPGPEQDFLDARAARAMISAFPEAVEAANRLAAGAMSAAEFLSDRPVFPSWRGLPEEDTFRALRGACIEGARKRYGLELGGTAARRDGAGVASPSAGAADGGRLRGSGGSRPDGRSGGRRGGDRGLERRVAERLEKELRIIRSKGFSSYFLVVRDIVMRCPRTCGRGSAASSIVSYLLGLTHVDPLEHDLFFERFLNEDRRDPPDIDIDFPWDERPALLASVFAEYGSHAAMVADHCTFSDRGSVREAAIAMGMGPEEIRRAGQALRIGAAKDLPAELLDLAGLLKGVPRYIGTHPGGVVITPGPITEWCHVQPSPSGIPVLAWEKDGTERAGLVKIDLLGNRSLAVLRDCIEIVDRAAPEPERTGWTGLDPFADRTAQDLLESGRTMGIFYVESPATRRLLLKMGTADYRHLVAASSIIRPAANRYIDEYVRRLKGAAWRRLPEAVENALGETYGIMVYQEDVARVAMAAAGFSAADADGLRKVLTKKRHGPAMEDFRARFFAGCVGSGVPGADAEELWSMMLSFDGYSFCKAHSASYALVSYRLAWMKARHPAVFIASVINNGGGFYGVQAYLGEARRLGLDILPPHANLSGVEYRPEGPGLRVGLSQVKGLSHEVAARIAAGAGTAGGMRLPWLDLETLYREAEPSPEECRALVRSGCLDGIPAGAGGPPLSRPQTLWVLFHLHSRADKPAAGFPELLPWAPEAPSFLKDYGRSERLEDEVRFLGVIVSRMPAELYRNRAERAAHRLGLPRPVPVSAMGTSLDRYVTMAGTLTAAKTVATSDGRYMAFVTMEAEDGVFDVVLFPPAYSEALPILESHHAFLVAGRLRDDMGVPCLHAERIEGLNRGDARPEPHAAAGPDDSARDPRPGPELRIAPRSCMVSAMAPPCGPHAVAAQRRTSFRPRGIAEVPS